MGISANAKGISIDRTKITVKKNNGIKSSKGFKDCYSD